MYFLFFFFITFFGLLISMIVINFEKKKKINKFLFSGYDSSAGIPYEHSSSSLIEFPRIDLSWPFALKLNAFTLAKILLKLVLFKMIVKFIAVICLLLFIPKLEIIKKPNKDEAKEEGRVLFSCKSTFLLNIISS